jgi:putative endonuclease
MTYVYALWSVRFAKVYIGMSQKPDQRLEAHNLGKSKWTRRFRPWIRFYLKEFDSREEARKHEKYLKSGWGRRGLMKVLEERQRELR